METVLDEPNGMATEVGTLNVNGNTAAGTEVTLTTCTCPRASETITGVAPALSRVSTKVLALCEVSAATKPLEGVTA